MNTSKSQHTRATSIVIDRWNDKKVRSSCVCTIRVIRIFFTKVGVSMYRVGMTFSYMNLFELTSLHVKTFRYDMI